MQTDKQEIWFNADYDYPYYFAFCGSMTRELTELYIKHEANLQLYE
jgi:hypothetical protein